MYVCLYYFNQSMIDFFVVVIFPLNTGKRQTKTNTKIKMERNGNTLQSYKTILQFLSGEQWHRCDPIECHLVAIWVRCMHCPFQYDAVLQPGYGERNGTMWSAMHAALHQHKKSHSSHTVQLWYGMVPHCSAPLSPCEPTPGYGVREQLFQSLGVLTPSGPLQPPSRVIGRQRR